MAVGNLLAEMLIECCTHNAGGVIHTPGPARSQIPQPFCTSEITILCLLRQPQNLFGKIRGPPESVVFSNSFPKLSAEKSNQNVKGGCL